MKIVVLAERFEDGAWRDWEHTCDEEEVDAVADSAMAKASDRSKPTPLYSDYLFGARYIFNVAFGPLDQPKDGDTRVYAAVVDGMLIGEYSKIEQHFLLKPKVA